MFGKWTFEKGADATHAHADGLRIFFVLQHAREVAIVVVPGQVHHLELFVTILAVSDVPVSTHGLTKVCKSILVQGEPHASTALVHRLRILHRFCQVHALHAIEDARLLALLQRNWVL